MRKIGLVGGTGPESTAMYYKELNLRADKRTGGREMPDMAIESVDFRRAWEYVTGEKYDLLASYLADKANHLYESGCEVIALTAGTMHIVYDEITSLTKATLISIPEAVAEEAKKKGYKKVGLLGTVFTMEKDYMKKDLRNLGIEVIVPDKKSRDLIGKRIFEELEVGIVKEETLKEFQMMIEDMKEKDGIEAVILGCTELPLLLNSSNCPLPVLDSVDIHIETLLALAMA
jgi:aspartate racemase